MQADPSGPDSRRFSSSDRNNSPAVLSCRAFGVAFGAREIFSSLDFELAPGSVSILTGPEGSGKSTLLRTLAGVSQQNSRFRCWGEARYLGQALGDGPYPWLVRQDARLMQASVLDTLVEALRAHPDRPRGLTREGIAAELQALGVPKLAAQLSSKSIELPTVLQRAMPIVAATLRGAPLLLLDEPTARLSEEDADCILALIASVARSCTVLAILHDEQHAERIGTQQIAMGPGKAVVRAVPAAAAAGASVREASADSTQAPGNVPGRPEEGGGSPQKAPVLPAPAEGAAPKPEGSARDVPSPLAAARAPAARKRPVRDLSSSSGLAMAALLLDGPMPEPKGPRGFCWIVENRLAGTPLPGTEPEVEDALAALSRAGVTRLITLTEKDIPPSTLARHGLSNLHLPVRDREPPTVAQTNMLLIRMQGMLDRGEVLAVHCSDGMGRTGTVLAAWLIREGALAADKALARLRRIDPGFVQSTEQENFLHLYENSFLKN